MRGVLAEETKEPPLVREKDKTTNCSLDPELDFGPTGVTAEVTRCMVSRQQTTKTTLKLTIHPSEATEARYKVKKGGLPSATSPAV